MPDNPPPPSPPSGRRGFFGDALRELITPVAGILEKRIQPVLNVLETLPAEAERLAALGQPPSSAGPLDQPQAAPRHHPLPVKSSAAPGLPDRYLRPPGAMAPGHFEQVCSQCGYCVEACPASAIRLDPHGLAGDGFPYILPADQPCVVCDSLACMKSCPSGALKLVDRLAIHLGSATVNSAACLRDRGEACTLCIDVCPLAGPDHTATGALDALFVNEDTGRIRVRKNVCIGCGLCESRCPTDPPAITIIPAKGDHDVIIA